MCTTFLISGCCGENTNGVNALLSQVRSLTQPLQYTYITYIIIYIIYNIINLAGIVSFWSAMEHHMKAVTVRSDSNSARRSAALWWVRICFLCMAISRRESSVNVFWRWGKREAMTWLVPLDQYRAKKAIFFWSTISEQTLNWNVSLEYNIKVCGLGWNYSFTPINPYTHILEKKETCVFVACIVGWGWNLPHSRC